jgi:3-phenylpropionate/trans-cinnamate dioxygenase ferredoxin reductase subunit
MQASSGTFVIVGAGLAGARAAETLREEGFDGRIVLLGDEAEPPYERPPLSKDYLRRETRKTPVVHPEGFYAANDIDLQSSTRVTGIDAGMREVLLEGDRRLGYDRLLLATGAIPRRLDVPGADLAGVHYLRTLWDSAALADRIERGGHLTVVGSGWIGSEIAASARQRDCQVTMLEMASLPLERVLGPEVAQIYLDIHRDHGVEFLPETTVERFEGQGRVERVITRDGAKLETDFVVVGIGVAPRVGLAESAGLRIDNGILADQRLETSAPGVFAAGDVANAVHPFYGHPVRVEHWANALAQGPAAARSMLGQETAFDEIPYFFSDQYDVGMEYRGFATTWDEVVFRGAVEDREFIAFWLERGRVVAGMNVNVWDVNERIRDLIVSRRRVDVTELVDPEVPLSRLGGSISREEAGAAVAAWASEGGSL